MVSSLSVFDPPIVEPKPELTRHVASRCLENRTRMIWVSSASVYGSHEGVVNEFGAVEPPGPPYATFRRAE
jgi:nucleoside-diphosphate-sugar epimerase